MEKLLVHIARQGQSLGSFSEEEVREGVASKRFSKEDDLAWTSGMTEWRPLSEVMAAGDDSLPGPAIAPAALPEPAWERRSELGFFKALFQTIFEVLFSPSKTFSKMKTTGGLGTALLFYAITHIVETPLACLSQSQGMRDIFIFIPSLDLQLKMAKRLHDFVPGISLQNIMTMGLKMILGLFMTAALYHLSLKILKSARGPFEATFRVFCYTAGSYALIGTLFCLINLAAGRLGFIPINIRISIYIIEMLVGVSILGTLHFIGLKQVHHLSSGRTTFVLLFAVLVLPILVSLALILLVAILIAIILAAKHFMH